MGLEQARQHLKQWDREEDIMLLDDSSATVELAAQALGVTADEIAKSISLYDKEEGVILIVASGQRRVDSKKFKDEFGLKAKMLPFELVEPKVGHPVGGVCPFGVNSGVRVFLDISLKKWDFVYPACGNGQSAIKLSIAELEEFALPIGWVDVTKD